MSLLLVSSTSSRRSVDVSTDVDFARNKRKYRHRGNKLDFAVGASMCDKDRSTDFYSEQIGGRSFSLMSDVM